MCLCQIEYLLLRFVPVGLKKRSKYHVFCVVYYFKVEKKKSRKKIKRMLPTHLHTAILDKTPLGVRIVRGDTVAGMNQKISREGIHLLELFIVM